MLENFGKKIGNFAHVAAKKSGKIAQTAAKKSGEIAQTAAKKSGDMVETTRLNISINGEEESLKKLYTEIGKLYFESINNGEPLGTAFGEICDKVKEHHENIVAFKEKIKQMKGN